MVWMDKLADDTHRTFRGATSMRHSKSYKIPGMPSGENLASGSTMGAERAVNMWYSEVKDCGQMPGCKRGARGTVGHFTALVWKGATNLGCAISDNKRYGFIVASCGGALTANAEGQIESENHI